MEIISFDSAVDLDNGYKANVKAILKTPYGEVEVAIGVWCAEGSPKNLTKCILGLAEDVASTLLDSEYIDQRAEDF